MKAFILRPISPQDSLVELTALLHRAFAHLGRMGLACSSVSQPVAVTRQRIEQGECFVAESDGRIVGTVTLYPPEHESPSEVYRSRRVASMHQFAVDPEFQGRGLGRKLLELAEAWAARHGYQELALDTPQTARHLISFYRHHGFRFAGIVQFTGRTYCSAMLLKAVAKRFAIVIPWCLPHASDSIDADLRPNFATSLPPASIESSLQPNSRPLRGVRMPPPLLRGGLRIAA